jgi:hypothetical protein
MTTELSKEEPILFPKAVDELTDEELSGKVEDVLEYLHHMPSDLSCADKELLKEMKERFDLIVASRSDLAEKLKSMLSYPDNLSGSDQATLEELLVFISPPAKSL